MVWVGVLVGLGVWLGLGGWVCDSVAPLGAMVTMVAATC